MPCRAPAIRCYGLGGRATQHLHCCSQCSLLGVSDPLPYPHSPLHLPLLPPVRSGTPLPGWPIQMGDIQGQPLVADINNDGELEVVAGGRVYKHRVCVSVLGA